MPLCRIQASGKAPLQGLANSCRKRRCSSGRLLWDSVSFSPRTPITIAYGFLPVRLTVLQGFGDCSSNVRIAVSQVHRAHSYSKIDHIFAVDVLRETLAGCSLATFKETDCECRSFGRCDKSRQRTKATSRVLIHLLEQSLGGF